MTPEDEPSMLECIQYATGEEQRAIMNSSTRNEVARLKWKWHSVVDVLAVKGKCNAIKNNIAEEPGMSGPVGYG